MAPTAASIYSIPINNIYFPPYKDLMVITGRPILITTLSIIIISTPNVIIAFIRGEDLYYLDWFLYIFEYTIRVTKTVVDKVDRWVERQSNIAFIVFLTFILNNNPFYIKL